MSFIKHRLFLFFFLMSSVIAWAETAPAPSTDSMDKMFMYSMLSNQRNSSGSGLQGSDNLRDLREENACLAFLQSEEGADLSVIETNLKRQMRAPRAARQAVVEAGDQAARQAAAEAAADVTAQAKLAQEMYSQLVQYKAQCPPPHTADGMRAWVNAQIQKNNTRIDELQAGGEMGLFSNAAMQGLAGPNGRFLFSNGKANTSFMGAVGAGLTYRTMNVIGDEFEKLIRREGIPIIDTVVGGPLRGFKEKVKGAWYWLFHGGARPYTLNLVAQWKTEVDSVILDGLAEQAAKATGSQSDGFGARARMQRFDDMEDQPAEKAEEVVDVSWRTFVDGLARDLDRLTLRIEVPKRFYSPCDESDEALMSSDGRLDLLDTATRIQEVLQFIKTHLLLPTRNIKDLAAEPIKHLLPRIKKEITARFSLFEGMVSQYHHQIVGATGAASKPAAPTSTRKDNALGYSGLQD